MRELYRIRGDFAHGKMRSKQPMAWNLLEHIVLGTIAFPLILRKHLAVQRLSTMTSDDQSGHLRARLMKISF